MPGSVFDSSVCARCGRCGRNRGKRRGVESRAEAAAVAGDDDADDACVGRARVDRRTDLAQRVVRERVQFFGPVQAQHGHRIVDRQLDVAVRHTRLNRMPHA